MPNSLPTLARSAPFLSTARTPSHPPHHIPFHPSPPNHQTCSLNLEPDLLQPASPKISSLNMASHRQMGGSVTNHNTNQSNNQSQQQNNQPPPLPAFLATNTRILDHSMLKETEIGTNWWADQLTELASPEQLATFKSTLQEELMLKYQGHWDSRLQIKGSAYRSVTADSHRLDPLLVKACEEAKIALEDFARVIFRRGNDHIMFINPGEVRIRNGALLTTASSLIWPLPKPGQAVHSSATPTSGITTPGGSVLNATNAAYVPQTMMSRNVFTPNSQHGSQGMHNPAPPQLTVNASAFHPHHNVRGHQPWQPNNNNNNNNNNEPDFDRHINIRSPRK